MISTCQEISGGYRCFANEWSYTDLHLIINSLGTVTCYSSFSVSARRYRICFAPSNHKVLLQEWEKPVPSLTLVRDQLKRNDNFVYLGSCKSASSDVSYGIDSRILNAGAVYSNLDHLWPLQDVSHTMKDRIQVSMKKLCSMCGKPDLSKLGMLGDSAFDHC